MTEIQTFRRPGHSKRLIQKVLDGAPVTFLQYAFLWAHTPFGYWSAPLSEDQISYLRWLMREPKHPESPASPYEAYEYQFVGGSETNELYYEQAWKGH